MDDAFPGDVVGLFDTGNFKIGDTLTEGEIYDITVERKHFAETLEENLPYYIREEQYEDCSRIVKTISELKNPVVKQRGRPKKS